METVFDWLDRVRARPKMYLRQSSLIELEAMLWGYHAALAAHQIVEPLPSMGRHFLYWLMYRTGWSGACGWAAAITDRHKSPEAALAAFFEFVDEYRRLRPTLLCSARLAARHTPTGKRVPVGFTQRMDKPRRVDILRYRPAPLHFLRFHYDDRTEDDDTFMSTLANAKRWVRDELQVEAAVWKPARPVPRHRASPTPS